MSDFPDLPKLSLGLPYQFYPVLDYGLLKLPWLQVVSLVIIGGMSPRGCVNVG